MFRMLSVAVAPVSSETLIEFSSRRSLDHLQFWRECPAVLELLYNTNYSFDYGLFLHPFLSMFLRSDRIKQGSLRPFYISLEEAQQEVAEKCVAYLLQAEFPWSHSGFSGYSERYWHVHAANMPPYGSAKLDRTFQQRCIQLLDQQTYAFRYWTSSMGSIWSDFDYKEDYPPPLYYATLLDLYECARMLLDDHAADPAAYHPAAKYQCPFIAAVDNGKDRFVYLFTKYGVNADMIVDGGTPLFRAAKSGHSGVIQMLLDAGADVRARDFRGNTPLLEAIAHGQTETAKLLIDTGSNIEARSNNENNPLLLAVRNGHLECVKLLTNTGADIGARDHSGNTPLLLAIDKNRLECAKWLIDTGADIEARDNGGKAPLSLAILTGHTECAKLLLDAGADFEADNVFGSTPLLVAIDHNRIDCAKLLIMKGADFQAQDTWGRSAFHLCHPNSPMMELLLDAGANVDEEDGFGNTALYCAVDVSNHLKVESLLNAGANPNPRQRDAVWSPLKTAIMRYREHEKAEDEGDAYKYGHIISLLLRHGAELETEWITEEWSEGLRIVCGISG